jgi:hypothetical protein
VFLPSVASMLVSGVVLLGFRIKPLRQLYLPTFGLQQ